VFSSVSTPRVCVVGGGPAGFYTAQQLLKVCVISSQIKRLSDQERVILTVEALLILG